jgi:hypothetical protein
MRCVKFWASYISIKLLNTLKLAYKNLNPVSYNKNKIHPMKYYLLSTIILFTHPLFSQVIFTFEDSSLDNWQQSVSGHWAASAIGPLNGNYSLHHIFDNPDAGHDQVSYSFQDKIDMNSPVHWSFLVRHTYNPSSANNWSVFLISDLPAESMFPNGQASGIAVGVNFTGSDDILKLWKIEKGSSTAILQSSVNWEQVVGDTVALLDIEKDAEGNYSLKLAVGGQKEQLKPVGSCFAPYILETNCFGIYYKYSSSQDRKLWIDDIHIDANFITDTSGPIIDTAYIFNNRQIVIVFDEKISSASIKKENFTLVKGNDIPDSVVVLPNDVTVKLYFHDTLPQGKTIWLSVAGTQDLLGNAMKAIDIGLSYYIPKAYDVLITEIMANPDSTIGLPNAEYIELYNRSDYPINLEKWQFTARNYIFTLPKIIIPTHGHAILCNCNGKKYFNDIVQSLCWGNSYLLTNTGTNLSLIDSLGINISSVTYSDDWYNDTYKKSGGWSLEMIDPQNPCGGKENWLPSVDKSGGTPGRQNSVWGTEPDNSKPEFLYARVPNDSNIILHFSEPLHFGIDSLNFFINGGIGYPVSMFFSIDDFSSIILNFKKKFETGKNYELHIKKNVCDCVGNFLADDLIVHVAMPQQPDSFDVVINEVLFNPYPYGSGFVEIYNRSAKVIDAGSLIVATLDTIDKTVKYSTKVADDGFLLFPGNFLAITGSVAGINKHYTVKDKKAIVEQFDFPTLPDNKGIIAILDKSYSVLDEFNYNVAMHFAQLSSSEGVSLERLRADLPTQLKSNWHSASQTSGYATPGYINSQAEDGTLTSETGEVSITPEVFTPDNDGHDDVLTIKMNPGQADCTATINIYNSSGRIIKHLLPKSSLSLENTFTWDGTSDEHKVQPSGIYLLHFQLFYGNGKVKEIKKTCVLGLR